MRILGLTTPRNSKKSNLSAVDWWRVVNPLTVLKRNTDWTIDIIHDEPTDWESIGRSYDVVLTSYVITKKMFSYLRALHEKYGLIHIMDFDDDVFDVDPMSPSRLQYNTQNTVLEGLAVMIKEVDIITTSTQHLQKLYKQRRGNNEVALMPNYIDEQVYKRGKTDKHDSLVVGYQGSSTHFTDIFKTGYIWAIRRILAKYPHVRYGVVGWYEELRYYLPFDRIDNLMGSGHHSDWVKCLMKTPIDIGTAPLYHSSFNEGKSSIKYYEYAMKGIPGVYENWQPYKKIKENETGYTAQSEDEWVYWLSELIESEGKRKEIADKAYTDVVENYSMNKHWKDWKMLLEAVCTKK